MFTYTIVITVLDPDDRSGATTVLSDDLGRLIVTNDGYVIKLNPG